MSQREFQQKIRLFINEPTMLKHYLERNQTSSIKGDKLRSIFPPAPQLQRFRHLQYARLSAQRDLALDGFVLEVIGKFEGEVKVNSRTDKQLQNKKQNCLKKLKMDYVEEQMTENLSELERLIQSYEHYNGVIKEEKGFVEKMIMITEIKKALVVQNSILKKENEVLKRQEEELDKSMNNKKKK